MPRLVSVNLGVPEPTRHSDFPTTSIHKRPTQDAVAVRAPGPKGVGGSGLAGDTVSDQRYHGGDDQAVYAYAREDLDAWERELGRVLPCGAFGENLTTEGLDVTEARIGERWRVGTEVVLEVSCPRIPCRTFAGWMGDRDWVRRFTQRRLPGAYLRVLAPGRVRAGDPVDVAFRPLHEVTVALMFRALTTERALLPALLEAGDALPVETRLQVADHLRHMAAPGAPAPGA